MTVAIESTPATLDRLRQHAVVIQIEGSSYRLRQRADLVPERPDPTRLALPHRSEGERAGAVVPKHGQSGCGLPSPSSIPNSRNRKIRLTAKAPIQVVTHQLQAHAVLRDSRGTRLNFHASDVGFRHLGSANEHPRRVTSSSVDRAQIQQVQATLHLSRRDAQRVFVAKRNATPRRRTLSRRTDGRQQTHYPANAAAAHAPN